MYVCLLHRLVALAVAGGTAGESRAHGGISANAELRRGARQLSWRPTHSIGESKKGPNTENQIACVALLKLLILSSVFKV